LSTAAPIISETISIDPARIAEFRESTPTLAKQATEFTIEDASDYEFSLTIAEEAIKRQKAIAEFFAGSKKLAFDLHRAICKMETDLLQPYMQIERLIKDRRLNWRQAEEQKRLKAEAEARRIAHEAEQARLLAEAAQLEKEGEKEAAEVRLEQAQTVQAPAVVVQSTVPKQAGSSIRKHYGYRIDNEAMVPREFCSPDPRKIKSHVDAYGMSAKISGVTVLPGETEAIQTKGR
jgi:hypothetical protein